jgi:hypothetical protein
MLIIFQWDGAWKLPTDALAFWHNAVVSVSSYIPRVQTAHLFQRGHKRMLLEQSRADTWQCNRVLLNANDQAKTKLSLWRQLAIMSPKREFYVIGFETGHWRCMCRTATTVATYILEWPGQLATCNLLVTKSSLRVWRERNLICR